jgi:hypothetical protein
MRQAKRSSEYRLRGRATISNGDFDSYWSWHLAQEHQRVHKNRYTQPATIHDHPSKRATPNGDSVLEPCASAPVILRPSVHHLGMSTKDRGILISFTVVRRSRQSRPHQEATHAPVGHHRTIVGRPPISSRGTRYPAERPAVDRDPDSERHNHRRHVAHTRADATDLVVGRLAEHRMLELRRRAQVRDLGEQQLQLVVTGQVDAA